MDLAALDEKVTASMKHKAGCCSDDQISSEICAALLQNPDDEEMRALNYRWQCHLNREYVEKYNVDSLLERLTDHVLTIKPEHPIAEMIIALEQDAKSQKQ